MGRTGATLAVVLGCLTSVAYATPEADKLFEEGRKLLDTDPAAACAKFDQAIKLDPDAPGVLLNLGLCNEKVGKYKSALYWFRKAQARSTESNLPDYVQAAAEHTRTLTKQVARVNVQFAGSPPSDVKVRIDGELIAPDDYTHAEVDPGHHSLDAGASGMRIVHQDFDIKPTPVGADGETVPLPPIAFVAGNNTEIVDRGAKRRKLAWIAMIGGGSLMVISGAYSAYEKHEYNKCVNADHTINTMACPNDTANYENNTRARHVLIYGTTTFVIGAAAAAAGLFLYFTAPEKERIERTVLAPTVSPDGVGLAGAAGSELLSSSAAGRIGADVVDHALEHGIGLGSLALCDEHAAAGELCARVTGGVHAAVESGNARLDLAIEHGASACDLAGLAQRVDLHRGCDHAVLVGLRVRIGERGEHGRPVAA